MNKQIEKFIDDAKLTAVSEMFEDELIKFAELVVRECAEIQQQRFAERHGYDKHEDASAIKQHFGIEE